MKPGDPFGEAIFQIRRSGYGRRLRAYLGRYTLPPTDTGRCIPFIQDCSSSPQSERLFRRYGHDPSWPDMGPLQI
jgi:hypothetical protein